MREELLKITNSHIRNLAWLLFSPVIRVSEVYQYDAVLFPNDLLDEWFTLHKDWLIQQDNTPQAISIFLAEQERNVRLGFYAEDLLHYFFRSSPHIELLLVNEQIVVDRVTQTEIDFLIEYKGQLIHLVVAVKYYLKYSDGEWIGPDARDSLRKKWQKVMGRQLPKAQEFFQDSFPAKEIKSYFFLKGYLFYQDGTNHQWIHTDDLEDCSQFGNRFAVAYKPNWMMDFHAYTGKTEKWETLRTRNELQPIKKATPIVSLSKYNQTVIFVVPNDWPQLDNHR